MPLQHHTPSDRVKPSNPDLLRLPHLTTQRAGASPHPPLDSSLSSPRRRHRSRGPRHTCLMTSCHRFVSYIAIRMMNIIAPYLKIPIKQLKHTSRTTASCCTSHAAATATKLASQVVACAIFRRCTAPESPSKD